MLNRYAVFPTLPTSNMERAKEFYEDILGFTPFGNSDSYGEGCLYMSGTTGFLVYPSQYTGTNKATSMSFNVPDEELDGLLDHLRQYVDFDTFETESGEWQDGVLSDGETRSVWFKDPDGNIINVNTIPMDKY